MNPKKNIHNIVNTIQSIRIIGGQYKRSKLDILNIEGLRPTPDRLRETLFNWLGDMHDMNCLDMFAGSGVLGFECLSRYAKYVLMIEAHKQAYQQIVNIADKLKIEYVQSINLCENEYKGLKLIHADSLSYLSSHLSQVENKYTDFFNVIFIDPPYAKKNLLDQSLLIASRLLHVNGLIYVEYNQDLSEIIQISGMRIAKHIKIGQIFAYLLRKY